MFFFHGTVKTSIRLRDSHLAKDIGEKLFVCKRLICFNKNSRNFCLVYCALCWRTFRSSALEVESDDIVESEVCSPVVNQKDSEVVPESEISTIGLLFCSRAGS